MSSATVRSAINQAIADACAPLLSYDLSDYVSIEDALGEIDTESVLIQYVASGEVLASIGGEGNQCWEETGSVAVHLVVPTGFVSGPTVATGDSIRKALRGRRLGDVAIEEVSPFVDFGVASGVNGAWHSWVSNIFYVRRLHGGD